MAESCARPWVKIYCEFKKALSLLNTSLICDRFTGHYDGDVGVIVEENCFQVHHQDSSLTCNFGDHATLYPMTCRGLKFHQEGELQFTLQVESESSAYYVPNHDHARQLDYVETIELYQNKCFCSVCGNKILADSCIFSKVLALPSENWADHVDMWFCHRHDDESPTTSAEKIQEMLVPKEKQCMVGDSFFLVQDSELKLGHSITKGGLLQCQRCGAQIGVKYRPRKADGTYYEPKTNVHRIFRHAVHFYKPLDRFHKRKDIDFGHLAEDYFANLIVEQSHLYTSFRLMVEAKNRDSIIQCLIWLIDPSLMIFLAQVCFDDPTFDLVPKKVLKLLFKCRIIKESEGPPPSPEHTFSSWKLDPAVHSFHMPYPMVLQLLKFLLHNTKCIPRSQRYLNKFVVGFLKYLSM